MITKRSILLFAFLLVAFAINFLFVVEPSPAQQRQVLPTRLSAPEGVRAVGRLPGSKRLSLALTLRLRNQQELDSLLRELYDPASPNYRQFLTVEQFTERFGPTIDDYERVGGFVGSYGLTVTHTAPNRLVLDVSGTVADIERAFGVTMQVYQHPTEPRTFYAPNVEPSLDPSLPVQGIGGLSDFSSPRPADLKIVPLGEIAKANVTGSGPGGAFLGSDIRAAYAPGVTLAGSGQAVGLFENGGYNLSDVQLYFSNVNQPLKVPIVNVLLDGLNGECPAGCNDAEEAIDIEQAISMAPNLSSLIVYEGTLDVDILNQMATDNSAKQLSCSYVWNPDSSSVEPIFQEFAAQGQNLFASSGDGGAFTPPSCTSNCWSALFPAADPYVTAVGGTDLTTTGPGGAWQSETAWVDSGGGITSFPIPSYQAPVINSLNQGSTTLRNVPDVAAEANTDSYVCVDGGCAAAGGTSISTPRWAGFLALANEQANGAAIGFLNPAIYGIAQGSNYGNDFHDITSGNNFNSYSPDLYTAVTGYDLVTGLGSPNGQSLLNVLGPAPTGPNFTVTASPSTLSVLPGGQASSTITITAVNGFSGAVSLSATVLGQLSGVTASLSPASITGSGASTLTLLTSDSQLNLIIPITVTGTSGGLTQTAYITLAILRTATPTFSVPSGIYSPPLTVTISDATAGATIYYTTNGTTPTTASTQYTGAITVGSTETIEAIATATGYATSAVAATTYTMGSFTTLHSFDFTDGAHPYAGLVQATDGNFYGTATNGGANSCIYYGTNFGCGTVFQITPGGTLTTLHNFDSTDGAWPYAGLLQATDGNFYGTTQMGGANDACNGSNTSGYTGCGTVFKITLSGTLTSLYSFCALSSCADGDNPYAALVQGTDGNFYGTTQFGGASGYGTVFKITPSGALTTLYGFDYKDGGQLEGALVQGTDGNFYGTTVEGGTAGYGTVFKITPSGALTTLYSFCSGYYLSGAKIECADGMAPSFYGSLVQGTDGNFYGTTTWGGANDLCRLSAYIVGCGTVFKITPSGTLTTLYSFCSQSGCTDGSQPDAGLVQATDGNLYGTTSSGGAHGFGSVFKITPGGTLTALYSFGSQTNCADGNSPFAPLVQDTDGNFYGTTLGGGANYDGTVFSLSVGLGPFVKTQPTSGPAGAVIIILGNNLGGATGVSFNGTPAAFTVVSDTEIQTTVPTGATPGPVQVTTANGTLNSNVAFNVTGLQSPPIAGVAPTSLTFSNQTLGTTSASQQVIVSNTGGANLTVTSIVASANFAEIDNCQPIVAVGGSCTINITFSPATPGPLTGTLTITDNSDLVAGSTQTVSLSGTGTGPVAGVSPGSLTFSAQLVSSTSGPQTVTLSNTGNAALAVASIATNGNFAQTNNCGSSVAAGGSCTINVTFTPATGGPISGSLTVTDNSNGTTGSTQTVSLSGTGQDFSLAPPSGSPTSATVAPGSTATYTLSVGSLGGLSGTVSFTCTGAPSEATCSVSPNPASAGTNVTVSVATTAPSALVPRKSPPPPLPRPLPLLLLAVLLAYLTWSVAFRRPGGAIPRRAVLLPIAAGLLLALALAGCGGGGGGVTQNPGTPAGAYTLTVTGTVGTGSSAVSHSVKLTLNVS